MQASNLTLTLHACCVSVTRNIIIILYFIKFFKACVIYILLVMIRDVHWRWKNLFWKIFWNIFFKQPLLEHDNHSLPKLYFLYCIRQCTLHVPRKSKTVKSIISEQNELKMCMRFLKYFREWAPFISHQMWYILQLPRIDNYCYLYDQE